MDFIPNATARHAAALCECCDGDIQVGQPIYIDEDGSQDGDGWRYRLRVQCGPCHDFVQAEVLEAVRRTYIHAADIARGGSDPQATYDTLKFKAHMVALQQKTEAA